VADFYDLQQDLFDHHRAGRYAEGLVVAERMQADFPDRSGITWYYVACLESRCGRPEAALATIRSALDGGQLWRLRTLEDHDFDSIRERPDFQELKDQAERRLRELRVEPRVRVTAPDGVRLPPLLLCLHGASAGLEQFAPYLEPAAAAGWLAVAAESSQPAGPDTRHWDDPERAFSDLGGFLNQVRAAGHGFDPGRVVLAGFSQGGLLAVDAALGRRPFPVQAVVGVCPSFPRPARLIELIQREKLPRLRGAFLVGEDDRPYRAGAEQVHEALVQAGHEVALQLLPGVGHEFPADFAERLPKLLTRLFD